MNRYLEIGGDKDRLIAQLRSDLWMARYALLNRAPASFHRLLSSYLHCESREATYGWLDAIAAEVIEAAELLPASHPEWGSVRAMCPICGEGANSYYEQGFAFPEGLRRHLVGYGRTQQCVFTDAAMKLARDSWVERFSEEEARARAAKLRNLDDRRKVEIMFQTSPFGQPVLIDEGIYGDPARSAEQLHLASKRLSQMGMTHVKDGRVESWVDEREKFVVYADPRQIGRIQFTVWKKPLPKRAPVSMYKHRIGSFFILDSWVNDLAGKYAARLPKEG